MDSKDSNYATTVDQLKVDENEKDKILNSHCGNEKIVTNSTEENPHIFSESNSYFIAIPKDIISSIIYHRNEEANREQNETGKMEEIVPTGTEVNPHIFSELKPYFIVLPKDIMTPIIYYGNEEPNQEQNETKKIEEFKTYKTRFWTLGLFSYISFVMILVWASFGSILSSAEYGLRWDDRFIALFALLGSGFSVIFMIPFNRMTHKYGLTVGMLTVCTLISLASGLRCISLKQTTFSYLAGLGAALNGAARCLLLSLPAMLSMQWFPMNERVTATAICTIGAQLGIAGIYFSPLIVRSPDYTGSYSYRTEIVDDIHILMLIYFGIASSAFLCAVFYFPAKPPTPPSTSSTLERVDYFKSIKILIRNRDVMMVTFIYAFSLSIPFCWISVMNLSLSCLGISQNDSMWIAISASVSASIVTFIVARLTDRFHGQRNSSIAALLFGSSCSFFWFLLMTEEVITSSKVQVFIVITFGMSFQYPTVPLLIEFAAELAYPCSEIAIGALLNFLLDAINSIFFLLLVINSECYHWISYSLVGTTFFTIIPLLFVKESYNRSDLDAKASETPTPALNTPKLEDL